MNKILSIKDENYIKWIEELKNRYKTSQIKAAIKVNSELIKFNWLLGKDITEMKADSRWGASFFDTLSLDLKKIFPNSTGFSPSNLAYMKRFYLLFPNAFYPQVAGESSDNLNYPQVVGDMFAIPWGLVTV